MIYIGKGEIVIAPKVKPEDINKFDANKKSPINRKMFNKNYIKENGYF
jgi:hypothetical protein